MQYDPSAEYFLDLPTAARFLKLSRIRLYALVNQGKITYFKPSGKLYFRMADLLHWIDAGKKSAGTK